MAARLRLNPGLAAIAAAFFTTACGAGGRDCPSYEDWPANGDCPSDPAASILGTGSRISEILGEAEWLDPKDSMSASCSPPADSTVHITGVTVTALDRFDEVSDGALGNLYVQDTTVEPGEYEGMTIFDPSFTPPDLRTAPGDVLDFFGVYQEFLGPSSGFFGKCKTLPEIGGTGTFRFEGSDTPALVVELQEIFGYANARRYLGMLLTLEDVTIGAEPVSSNGALPSGGRYTIDIDRTGIDTMGVDAADYPKLSNELFDLKNQGPTMTKGTHFKSVTGVLTYFYGFKIAPRSLDDFVL